MTIASILDAIPKLAQEWGTEREDRQQRIEADPADFKCLPTLVCGNNNAKRSSRPFLTALCRGHGMKSTNSHAFLFTDYPATRVAWPNHSAELVGANGDWGGMALTSVVAGVVDTAMAYTHERLRAPVHQGTTKAFQQVEWTLAEQEAWLIDQAWERANAPIRWVICGPLGPWRLNNCLT